MRRKASLFLTSCIASCLLVTTVPALAQQAFEITALDSAAPAGFDQIFSKQVEVFGLRIYASPATRNRKVLHTANVFAQYLDNDEDGIVDNPRVHARLLSRRAAMIMFRDEDEFDTLDGQAELDEIFSNAGVLQNLFDVETIPRGAARGRFDATLEEVLHLVTHGGYSPVYNNALGERSGSRIARAMDRARGGHFEDVPAAYPADAWYTYDDTTCDYSCQITEYFYWGLTSILGGQDFPGRLEAIEHEWRPNTREKVQATDRRLFRLLTRQAFRLPTRLPDGSYQPSAPR